MTLSRRDFLRFAGAGGAALLANPRLTMGAPSARRFSKLRPGSDLFVVHTDLHNHSLISGDAFGDPQTAYGQMRARGIDVACLTEHSTMGKGHGEITCPGHEEGGCHKIEGINDADWATLAGLADAAYDPHAFVSFRGFEWTTPTMGHVNVWFSERFTDALHEGALVTPPAAAQMDEAFPVPSEIVDNFEKLPDTATMRLFYEWLASDPDRPARGGGNDGLACFNHPNEYGNFEAFRFDPSVVSMMVSIEALNGTRDFLWWGTDKGKPNPINACLNAGWRVGFTGVSDEHSTTFGRDGMARGGLWVRTLTRGGVRKALKARHSFATFEPGLRLDATANGVPMGSAVAHGSGPVAFALDIDNGEGWAGKPIVVEVIGPGSSEPTLLAALDVTMPAPGDPPVTFTLPVDADDSAWVFLRVTDPSQGADPLAPAPYRSHGRALAYASPWFFSG